MPALEDGWVRVENKWLSVDPYMRGRMNDVKSYVPPFALGEPMQGGAVGKVVESRSPDLAEGETVFHMPGWREQAAGPAERVQQGAADPGRGPSVARQSRPHRRHRLFRAAPGRRGEGGRHRLRLGRGGRGRLGGGADRQGEGHDRDRLGRRRRQVRLGARARRRRGDRLQGGADREAADGGRAEGDRRLFRQCRRRPSRRRLRRRAPERPLRDLRDDRGLQHRLQPRLPLHHADHRRADHAEGLHLHRLSARDGRFLPRHGRLDRGRAR